jgi:RNA polymerase sigma factor (TIGR02999 family)
VARDVAYALIRLSFPTLHVRGRPLIVRAMGSDLSAIRRDNPEAVSDAFEAAYDQLRRVARRQLRSLRPGETLQTTALVNEAFLKLAGRSIDPADRHHFFALAARAMRQVLVDYARERGARKRGGDRRRTTLDDAAISIDGIAEEMLGIDRALTALEQVDERLSRLVEWRFFGGMTEEEIATAMGVTARTVRRDWQKARAFLYRELQKGA